ncbi:MAG: hypothetical protein ACI4I9_04015 [Porcipelethomonas sp.]
MENIVNRIVDIDRQADEKIAQARKKCDEMLEGISSECEKIKRELSDAADRRIAEVEKINRSELEASASELEREYSQELMEMDNFFEKNHFVIENAIFAETVGERV